MFDLYLVLSIFGLFFSIIFSSSELALLSANPLQINVWNQQKKINLLHWTEKILDNKEEFLIIILIGTNISNILATSFATIYLINLNQIDPTLIFLPIAIVILFIGEIFPKTFIRTYANYGIVALTPFLMFFKIAFYPLVVPLKVLGVMNVSKSITDEKELKIKRTDLQNIYENVDDFETMEKEQQEMISNVFEISECTVYDAMTPRIEISAVELNDSLEKALHVLIDSGHSKIPVYKDDLDTIVGIIYLYDLFKSPEKLEDVIKPITFIPYSKPLMSLMSEFQKNKNAIAIVLDEHGGTAGLITIEDVFEELLGDFEDEFDVTNIEYQQLEDGSIIADAKVDWKDFNDKFGKIIPEGDYETIGGFIINEIGRIPNQGENLFSDIGQIVIIKASSRRIDKIQLYPKKS
jgi:putative hemolysin|tara:strand:+ start:595 stop:1818 length:1224 start_codon:yes stop_codon:yes gene_type:complete